MDPLSLAALALAAVLLVMAWIRKIPIVMALAVTNFMVFLLGTTTGRAGTLLGSPLMADLAVKVAYFSADDWPSLYTIFTATFLHFNVAHVIGNMLTLLLIGVPFEDRVGRTRFLAIYFGTAVVAVLLHGVWILGQGGNVDVPLVGASGAVFGILGAFATMYPRDKVYVPILIVVRIPVIFAAIILAAMQGIYLFGGALGNVAYAAHIGGAVGGVILGLLLKPKVSLEDARQRPKTIDYTTLDRLATAPDQRRLIEKLRENEDHPDTQRAWLERLLPTLMCSQCGRAFTSERRGTLRCSQGHEERYAG